MTSLDEMLAPQWEGDEEGTPVALVGALEANRSLGRYKYWEQKLFEANTGFAAAINELKARQERVTRPMRTKMEWHEKALENFHRAQFAARGTGPTLKLPAGDLLLKAASPEVSIVDPDVLLAWAEESGVDVLPDRAPSIAKVKKAVHVIADEKAEPGTELIVVDPKTGVAVPGVRAVVRERNFAVVKHEKGLIYVFDEVR